MKNTLSQQFYLAQKVPPGSLSLDVGTLGVKGKQNCQSRTNHSRDVVTNTTSQQTSRSIHSIE